MGAGGPADLPGITAESSGSRTGTSVAPTLGMLPVLARSAVATPLHFKVLGPDVGGPALADLRRLFRGQRLVAARRNRLSQGGRILALCGTRAVGIAAFDRVDRDVRVYELGMDPESACGVDEIEDGLLDALELACMASGARRLVLLPRATPNRTVARRRGYVTMGEGTSGAWMEKAFA